MNIGLDYDKTYTNDPELWDIFIVTAMRFGHNVYIITARNQELDKNEELQKLEDDLITVIYCDGVAKRHVVTAISQHPGKEFNIDVWIDDKPESVLYNSPYTLEDLKKWRSTRER